MSVDCFATNPKTNELYSKCEECRSKHAEGSRAYKQSEGGKASAKRYQQSEKGKATLKRAKKKYRESDHGQAATKRYKQSEAGQASAKRYRESEVGQSTAKRCSKHRTDRCRASSAMRMDSKIKCASSSLLSGRYENSPTFVARTSFASAAAFRATVEATFPMVPGAVGQLRHRLGARPQIPREAYDFDNPEDIKRVGRPRMLRDDPGGNHEKP